jgi:hypothetical protein
MCQLLNITFNTEMQCYLGRVLFNMAGILNQSLPFVVRSALSDTSLMSFPAGGGPLLLSTLPRQQVVTANATLLRLGSIPVSNQRSESGRRCECRNI